MFKWIDIRMKYVFTLPVVFFVIIMIAFPLVYTFRLSFYSWGMSALTPMKWAGFSNFTGMFQSGRFTAAFARTFLFTFGVLAVEVVFGVAIALFLNREFFGKNVVKTLFLLPMVATPVAVGLIWGLIYEPSIGLANFVLAKFGIAPLVWLGSENSALLSLMLVDIWQWTPMVMLIVLSGLNAISSEPFESARVDGASFLQIIFFITLPLLRPVILAAVLLRLIDALKTFDIIYSTTQGGPGYATETMNILAFREAFEYFQFGRSAAALVLFFIIVLCISGLFIKIKNLAEADY